MGKEGILHAVVRKKTRMQAGRLLYPLDFHLLRT